MTVFLCLNAVSSTVVASDLDRGHKLLIENGLQIQALMFAEPTQSFDLSRWAQSNFTTVNAWHNDITPYLGTAPGIPWGRWVLPSMLTPGEAAYVPNLVSLQYRDEQDLTDPALVLDAAQNLQQMRSLYPNAMSCTNQWGTALTSAQLGNYMAAAQPDMVSFDLYPFEDYSADNYAVKGGSPTLQYSTMQKYRTAALAGNDGTGNHPIPYGQYNQTYRRTITHIPSESEMRLQHFTSWAFGYKFLCAFVYTDPNHDPEAPLPSALFDGLGDQNPTPAFSYLAETNRQSRNLGRALVRLLSTDVRMKMGQYKNIFTFNNPLPSGISAWNSSCDPYITSISATNLGTLNNGLRGDVVIGYFKALDEDFDGPSWQNQTYFMVTNGLCDPNGSAAQTRQRITLNFDFGSSGITSLQRLSRTTGQVEVVELTPLGGSSYRLELVLDGGTGDLFKFNTGAPFVGEDAGTLDVTVALEDYSGDPSLLAVRVELLKNGVLVTQESIMPSTTSPVISFAKLAAGQYTVRASASKCIPRSSTVTVQSPGNQSLTLTPQNGDVNGDGVISVSDSNILRSNFDEVGDR